MANNNRQPELQFPRDKGRKLDVSALESWLWKAACVIRGPLEATRGQALEALFKSLLHDLMTGKVRVKLGEAPGVVA